MREVLTKEEWREMTLGDIFEISSSKRVLQEQWQKTGVPFYRAREIVKLAKDGAVENELFISEELFDEYRKKYGVPAPGDLMVSAVGTLGACYVVQPHDRFYYKDASVLRLRPKQAVHSKFFQYAFGTSQILDQVNGGSGSTVGTFTIERANRTRIAVPSVAEQRRIAEILDKADALRAERRAALAQLDTLTQSIFLDMFGDRATILKRWPVRQLGEYLTFLTSGSRGWADYYADDGDVFLRIQNVRRDELFIDDIARVTAPQTAEAARTRVVPGDVLLSITADLGRTAVVPEDFPPAFINQHLAILRLTAVEPRFVSAFLSSPAGTLQVQSRNRQGVKAGLNFDDIRSFLIPMPPPEAQRAFAHGASLVDALKMKGRNAERTASQLFASLQHRAFRGEL